MPYSRKIGYPNNNLVGIYPSGSDSQLGFDSVDLEKFSLGSWNSISKSNRRYFVQLPDRDISFLEDLYEFETYLGRPVRVRLVDNSSDPILTWTLVKRQGGFVTSTNQTGDSGVLGLFGDTWNGGYNSAIIDLDYAPTGNEPMSMNLIPEQQWYADSATWYSRRRWNISDSARVGPLMPLSRFVNNYETDEVKRMFNFYRTLHYTYKRSDEDNHFVTDIENNTLDGPDNFSLAVREQIVGIFEEKYNDLKNIIDGEIGYIKELDPADYTDDAGNISGSAEIPIQLTFKTDIQSQIDEILSFNVEVYGDGRGVGVQVGAGMEHYGDTLPMGTIGLSGHWYHRFKLYFGSYNYIIGSPAIGRSDIDDVDRSVGNPHYYGAITGQVTDTYLPKDSYVLSGESPIEYWGGIYFEKLTDDGSIIKIGDVTGDGIYSGFTNTGRIGDFLGRFYFGLTISSQLILDLSSDIQDFGNKLLDIGHPFYTFNYDALTNITELGGEEQDDLDELDYEVKGTTESSDIDFLYYGVGDKYDETSYPVKMKLNIGLYGIENLTLPVVGDYSLLDQFYLSEYNSSGVVNTTAANGVYTYSVMQWGDEKNLLTDDQILNSEYFYLYTSEEVPTPDNYFYKRIVNNKFYQLDFTLGSFHIYDTPGVKSIKIIVYRYDTTGNVLLQTTLVTKNIVVNDGTLISQDFSIFGGTDFNFLPFKNNQAIIGGLDEDSKYNNSVEKIVKDDNFIQDDYLERASSRDFIDSFNKKLYGESPGQLDLSTTRVFKKPHDIYNFLNLKDGVMNQITGSGFPQFNNIFYDRKLKLNSFATDIFIDDENCIVELVPSELEYLTIPNEAGTNAKAILIGDYKVNQPKDGAIQREGVMQTPMLQKNQDKQAF